MKQITVNKDYIIINGTLTDVVGRVVGYDSIKDEVRLKVDPVTYIVTCSSNVEIFED